MSSPIYIQQSGNMTPGHFASWGGGGGGGYGSGSGVATAGGQV